MASVTVVGKIVTYTLAADDASRLSWRGLADRNQLGEERPAVIVLERADGRVNLSVFLDGGQMMGVDGAHRGSGEGLWR